MAKLSIVMSKILYHIDLRFAETQFTFNTGVNLNFSRLYSLIRPKGITPFKNPAKSEKKITTDLNAICVTLRG